MGACCGGNNNQVALAETDDAEVKTSRTNDTSGIPKSKANGNNSSSNNNNNGGYLKDRADSGGKQQLTIRIIQGKNLPKSDVFGKCDPFVVVSAGGSEYRTSIVRNTLNPIWNDDIILDGRDLFSQVKDLNFDLYDWDQFGKNDHLGHFEIHFSNDLSECETPALWYGLKDKDGKDIEKSEIQVQIQVRQDISGITARNWTYILQFTVQSGVNLHNMDWLSLNSDPYVSVEVGRQVFRTNAVKNSNNPFWNQSMYLFIDTDTQRDWQLVCNVLDKDLHNDDKIGTGYISIADIFDAEKRTLEREIPLSPKTINLDKKLGSIPISPKNGDSEEKEPNHCGHLKIKAQLIPRRKIEADFYEHLVAYFDINKDGKLAKNEVAQMLLYLEIYTNVDQFMERMDENHDDILSKEEVLKMLRDSEFQESDDSSKFILHHLKHDDEFNPFASKLMAGFFREDLDEQRNKKTLQVRSRKTAIIVQEHIPGYINFALSVMYDNSTGQLLSGTKTIQNVLHKMSRDKGIEYDAPESRKQIAAFVATHNLDITMLKKDISQFATFNDFFARHIRWEDPKIRPMTEDENDIVSPADCRMMVWDNIYDSTTFWVKGDKFSVENLLGKKRQEIASTFDGGAFCIARLAPQDYHLWHWPVSGTITNITPIDGALYTVNPIAVNKPVNVYTENKRCVIEVDTTNHGKMVMFAIAAAMVGSYNLWESTDVPLKVGSVVKRGDVAGEFRFGGSTILLLFERKKVEFKEDLVSSTNDKLETLIEVRDTIGGVPGKTNISDMVKQWSG